jgi:hypothetical protein
MQNLLVPNKLEASSFSILRRKMLINNTRLGGRVIYDIKPPSYKGASWYAFYTEKIDSSELLKEQLNDVAE